MDTVLFVARNLDMWPVPAALAGDALAFSSTARPYYRLTPQVWVWLCHAVDNLAANPTADRAQVQAGAELVVSLGAHVARHYPAEAIAAALAAPPSLPTPPQPRPDPPACMGSDAFVSKYCPLGVTRAAQAAGVQDAADRPPHPT